MIFVGILIIGILPFGISQTGSETSGEGVIDIGSLLFNLAEGEISGSGLTYEKIGEDGLVTFAQEDANLNIKGNSFENILPSSSENPSFIKMDNAGEILEADFTTNDNGKYNWKSFRRGNGKKNI